MPSRFTPFGVAPGSAVSTPPSDAAPCHELLSADRIHNAGCAIVWSGAREDAESYWTQLDDAGLTMGPLESG